jgi:hypothetical protein
MALWVEQHHGSNGATFIASRIAQLEREGEPGGVKLWQQVARRYSELTSSLPVKSHLG